MCRLIFPLLVVANIVPYLLEGFQSKCYKDTVFFGSTRGVEYVEEDCDTDVCYSIDCPNSNKEKSKGCGGECPEHKMRAGCKCSTCSGNLCNKGEDKGSTKECLVGYNGKFEKKKCIFSNNDGCQTTECDNSGPGGDQLVPNIEKRCGKCPGWAGDNCKCTDCTGDSCNQPVNKGNINQCYGPKVGKDYKPVNCTFLNNDGCHTIDCDDGKNDKKSCGKCPPPEEVPTGCKCRDCAENMCNKPVFVNKCYWGDDQKGNEAMECKADGSNNKACKVVKCRGGQSSQINSFDESSRTVDNPFKVGKVYRDCGKCSPEDMSDLCKCFTCNDQDLCNGGIRIESLSFVLMLAMIGGFFTLLAMSPLVGIGI